MDGAQRCFSFLFRQQAKETEAGDNTLGALDGCNHSWYLGPGGLESFLPNINRQCCYLSLYYLALQCHMRDEFY